jgi:uncharacterized protein
VFKQNIEYCPATFRLIERMMENANGSKADVVVDKLKEEGKKTKAHK